MLLRSSMRSGQTCSKIKSLRAAFAIRAPIETYLDVKSDLKGSAAGTIPEVLLATRM